MIGGGNRDPRHYENADAFLVERNPVDLLVVRLRHPQLRGPGTRTARGPGDHRGARPSRGAHRRRSGGAAAEQHGAQHQRAARARGGARHEDRPRSPAVRGARPLRGGGTPLMHLDDDGELVIDREEFEPGSADEAAASPPSASARLRLSGSNDVCPAEHRHRRQRHRGCHGGRHSAQRRLRRRDHADRRRAASGLQPPGAVEGAAARRGVRQQSPAAAADARRDGDGSACGRSSSIVHAPDAGCSTTGTACRSTGWSSRPGCRPRRLGGGRTSTGDS